MDPEQLLFGLNVTEYEIGHTIIFGVVLFFVSKETDLKMAELRSFHPT